MDACRLAKARTLMTNVMECYKNMARTGKTDQPDDCPHLYWLKLTGWSHKDPNKPRFTKKLLPGTRKEHAEYHKSFFHPDKDVRCMDTA